MASTWKCEDFSFFFLDKECDLILLVFAIFITLATAITAAEIVLIVLPSFSFLV